MRKHGEVVSFSIIPTDSLKTVTLLIVFPLHFDLCPSGHTLCVQTYPNTDTAVYVNKNTLINTQFNTDNNNKKKTLCQNTYTNISVMKATRRVQVSAEK